MHKLARLAVNFLEKILGKKFVFLPNGRDLQNKTAVKTDEGFWYVGNISDTHDLAYGILHSGVLERIETQLVKSILLKWLTYKSRINFYDIGANSGYYGLLAAFLGKGKIQTFSFEPLAEFCQSISESRKLNGLENIVTINNLALGSKKSEAEISVAGTGSSLNPKFLGKFEAPKRKVKVEKLDDYIGFKESLLPDFIKIDVEGFEMEVLKGAKAIIEKCKPVLYVEIARTLSNLGRDFVNPDFESIFSFLESFGYTAFLFDGRKLLPVEKSFDAEGVHMFLFVPQSQLQEIKAIF